MVTDTANASMPNNNADISQNARRAARIIDRLPNGEHSITLIKGTNGWEIRIPGLHDWVFTANPQPARAEPRQEKMNDLLLPGKT